MDLSRRRALAWFATFVAASAYGGAIGLATGALDLGTRLNHRLPFHSPALAACALSVIVGIPSTVVAVRAWRGAPSVDAAARVAGWPLLGWIGLEIAFIREFSFLQVVYGACGVVYVIVAERRDKRTAAVQS